MLRLTGDQRPQFRALFLGPNTHHLFSTAMEGNLPKTGLRGIAWGFFLGTLPAGMNVAGWARCASWTVYVQVYVKKQVICAQSLGNV